MRSVSQSVIVAGSGMILAEGVNSTVADAPFSDTV